MSKKVKVVAVSGGLQRPSRTLTLVEALIDALGERASIETRLIELGEVGPKLAGVLYPNQLPAEVRKDIAAIESADFLIVASPVYRASFTGLFKHLFDFVDHNALNDVPVLLASFAGIDPPFAAAERTKSRFIAITESRQLSEVERNLLRRAYEHVLG